MTDLAGIPTFAADGGFHVVVESPRGSSVKLKYDPRFTAIV
jgi:inorganic pyrophosphatase